MAKRDDKKEEALWRQATSGEVHALARLLNEHYDEVLCNLKRLNRLQTTQEEAIRNALDDAIVELLLTRAEIPTVAPTWYELAKVLASRRQAERIGERKEARGPALELLSEAKQVAAALRAEKEEGKRRGKQKRFGGCHAPPNFGSRRGKNHFQFFKSGAGFVTMVDSLRKR